MNTVVSMAFVCLLTVAVYFAETGGHVVPHDSYQQASQAPLDTGYPSSAEGTSKNITYSSKTPAASATQEKLVTHPTESSTSQSTIRMSEQLTVTTVGPTSQYNADNTNDLQAFFIKSHPSHHDVGSHTVHMATSNHDSQRWSDSIAEISHKSNSLSNQYDRASGEVTADKPVSLDVRQDTVVAGQNQNLESYSYDVIPTQSRDHGRTEGQRPWYEDVALDGVPSYQELKVFNMPADSTASKNKEHFGYSNSFTDTTSNITVDHKPTTAAQTLDGSNQSSSIVNTSDASLISSNISNTDKSFILSGNTANTQYSESLKNAIADYGNSQSGNTVGTDYGSSHSRNTVNTDYGSGSSSKVDKMDYGNSQMSNNAYTDYVSSQQGKVVNTDYGSSHSGNSVGTDYGSSLSDNIAKTDYSSGQLSNNAYTDYGRSQSGNNSISDYGRSDLSHNANIVQNYALDNTLQSDYTADFGYDNTLTAQSSGNDLSRTMPQAYLNYGNMLLGQLYAIINYQPAYGHNPVVLQNHYNTLIRSLANIVSQYSSPTAQTSSEAIQGSPYSGYDNSLSAGHSFDYGKTETTTQSSYRANLRKQMVDRAETTYQANLMNASPVEPYVPFSPPHTATRREKFLFFNPSAWNVTDPGNATSTFAGSAGVGSFSNTHFTGSSVDAFDRYHLTSPWQGTRDPGEGEPSDMTMASLMEP